jgi:hypothetical protein
VRLKGSKILGGKLGEFHGEHFAPLLPLSVAEHFAATPTPSSQSLS